MNHLNLAGFQQALREAFFTSADNDDILIGPSSEFCNKYKDWKDLYKWGLIPETYERHYFDGGDINISPLDCQLLLLWQLDGYNSDFDVPLTLASCIEAFTSEPEKFIRYLQWLGLIHDEEVEGKTFVSEFFFHHKLTHFITKVRPFNWGSYTFTYIPETISSLYLNAKGIKAIQLLATLFHNHDIFGKKPL